MKTSEVIYAEVTAAHRNPDQGRSAAVTTKVKIDVTSRRPVAKSSHWSHQGLLIFTSAHCKSQDIGWRFSFATAPANSQSHPYSGSLRRSRRCASLAVA